MKKILPLLGVAFVAAAFACGGAIDPGDGDAAHLDGSPAHDASKPNCPNAIPAPGGQCAPYGTTCEYGDDPNLQCNTIASCSSVGSWQVNEPSGECPTPPNASGCPSSFGDVPVGDHCGALVGLTCSYEQGFCGCSVGSGGPYPADASAVATWVCDAPETNCPLPRPQLGTACAQDGLQCDYSPCSLPTGTSIICEKGAWQENEYGCAL